MENRKKIITEKAHTIAKNDFGAQDAEIFMSETNDAIRSSNDAIRQSGLARAAEFTKKLTLLMLYQEIDNDATLGSKYSWIERFNDGRIANGNSKQYVAQIPTGSEPYNSNDFIPTKKSLPLVDSHIISIYERNSQGVDSLSSKAYQFNKPLTIQANEWLPYFKDGVLSEFISKLIGYMRECYKMVVLQRLQALIKALNPAKKINNNETDVNQNNLFLAMVNDVIPTIEEMKYYNKDFNYDIARGSAYACNADDIMVFCNFKILNKLKSGVMSRLFHSAMIEPSSYIPAENWIGLNKELNVDVDSNTEITTRNSDVLDENTMLIFDKNLIKHLIQVEQAGNQGYINNMTIQHNLHIWGVIDTIPWKKCVKYTNVNLSKQPN